MRCPFSFFPALENRKRSRKITSLAAHAIPGVAGQWLVYGDTLGILQQVFQVDRVVMPLPVHTYHPDQGSRRLGRLRQHATRWKHRANNLPSDLPYIAGIGG